MPNLLKYKDEYSRKSGHTPAQEGEGEKEAEGEGEKEADIIAPSADKPPSKLTPKPSFEPGVFELPLADKSVYGVPEKLYQEFISAYPGVSVMDQFSKMRVWIITNPAKAKTRSGMPRFMNRWLGEAQNDAAKNGGINGKANGRKESVLDRLQRERRERGEDQADSDGGGATPGDAGQAGEPEAGEPVGAGADPFQW
jgi:hypothetical protein